MISATATFTQRSSAGQFVSVRISPAVRASVEAAGKLIEDEAKLLCPVDTGALQASITTEVTEGDRTVTASVGPRGIGYAAFVEYGTGERGAASEGAGAGPYGNTAGQAAQPFMRPAIDGSREAVKELFRSQISLAVAG